MHDTRDLYLTSGSLLEVKELTVAAKSVCPVKMLLILQNFFVEKVGLRRNEIS
jgi:hypothetical protein